MNKIGKHSLIVALINLDEPNLKGFNELKDALHNIIGINVVKESEFCDLIYVETINGEIEMIHDKLKSNCYVLDQVGGNLYYFNINNDRIITYIASSDVTGSVSDIGLGAKLGLLNDFIETFIGVNFLEGNSVNIWEEDARAVISLLEKSFEEGWTTNFLLEYMEADKINKEAEEPIRPFKPFKRLSERDNKICIPSAKHNKLFLPDNWGICLEVKEPGFDVTIYGFSFNESYFPDYFNGEGFVIELDNNTLYCYDLDSNKFWVNRDPKNLRGYERFVKTLDASVFTRLFNNIEDLYMNYNENDINAKYENGEQIKKLILTLIFLLEVDMGIESSTVNNNIMTTVANIEEIINVTMKDIN